VRPSEQNLTGRERGQVGKGRNGTACGRHLPERSSAGRAPQQAALQLGGIAGLDEMAESVGMPTPTSSAR
jgi:hypothetical protein